MGKLKLIVEEGGKLRRLEFAGDERITIGRTNDNAVKISDALSSRQHCEITPDGGEFVVADLKSRNGTRLNGQPLTEQVVLNPGDRIEVGDSIVHFGERRAGGSGSSPRRGPPVKVGGGAVLRIVEGNGSGKATPIGDLPFLCGRKKSCALTLVDDDVSNEHCMIVEDDGLLQLVDLGSTNGTFVGGQRLRGRQALRAGDTIRLGTTLTLQIEVPGKSAQGRSKGSARSRKTSTRSRKRGESARRPKDVDEEMEETADAPVDFDIDEVEEVSDLDALGEDDEDEGPAPPPKKPKRSRSKRQRREKPDREARDAAELVALEGDVTDVEFGSGLQLEAEKLAGGGSGGLIAVGVALLLVLGAAVVGGRALLERPVSDTSPEENLLANWSFEEAPRPGQDWDWEIFADAGQFELLRGKQVRYGKQAVALRATPGTRPEIGDKQPVRVSAGASYSLRAALKADPGTVAALRIDWRSDTNPNYQRSSVVVVTDPDRAGEWRDVGGTAVAPRGASSARVAAVAISAPNAGAVCFDRLQLVEREEATPPQVLPGPSGLRLLLKPQGTLSIDRKGRALFDAMELVLDPSDPLSNQSAARVDQRLGSQTDGSLLALGSIPHVARGKRYEYAFSARAGASGLQLRWSGDAAVEVLYLRFRIPRLDDLQPLELDGTDLLAASETTFEGVAELAWGQGKSQVSCRFLQPANASLTRDENGGGTLLFALRPKPMAQGGGQVGYDLQPASRRAREALRRLVDRGDGALAGGRYAEASRAYRELMRSFPHEEAEVAHAKASLARIAARADRLVQVVKWARTQAEDTPVPQLVEAARSALRELEEGFADSPQLGEAQRELSGLESAVRGATREAEGTRVGRLLDRAKSLRAAGHTRLARMIYTHILAQFADDVPGVTEARNRLGALPPEEKQ